MRHANFENLRQTGAVLQPSKDAAFCTKVAAVSMHAPNDILFFEGDAAEHVFKVHQGTICLYKLMADGRRQVARFCYPGDFFGLAGSDAYAYTATALTDTQTFQIKRRDLEDEIERNSAARDIVFEALEKKMSAVQHQILLLGRKTAVERVASFLVALSKQASLQNDGGCLIELPMRRADIADYLGLTVESVCRILKRLKDAGIVTIPHAHRIELRDLETLKFIADGDEGNNSIT